MNTCLEILELISRYSHAADGRDPAAWANLFTEDGIFHVVARDGQEIVIQGREELIAKANSMISQQNLRQSRHNQVCPLITELTPDHATVRVYSLRSVITREPGSVLTISTTGVYYDDVVRTPKGWRFKKRKHVADPYPQPEAIL